ncbi:MAG: hypothetical protein OSJ54_06970 [Oscillospiraceae bacterium]|jgi:hypothetical protein|nr:hypothetical protein [Oscillospiraceae bacterium]
MKYTVNLKITAHDYVVAEPYEVSAGNKKSAESIAAALAMDKHGRDSVTEISVISAAEVRANA